MKLVRFTQKYVFTLVIPPLVILLPSALAFVTTVTRTAQWRTVVVAAVAVYALCAALYAWFLSGIADRTAEAIATRHRAPEEISDCLQQTIRASALLWIGAGAILAVSGSVLILPTFLGVQYFAEAALIVAAPAMAWSYWGGKRMLIAAARGVDDFHYRGRQYTIGFKIALVFIGFFIISVGALVHLVSVRVAVLIEHGVTDAETISAEIATYGLIIAVATALVFAVATYFLARDITSPLENLVRVADEMADGSFAKPPRVFADDEIGRLAERFGQTRVQLRELVARVSSRGGAITTGVRVMREGTDVLLTGAKEQSGMTLQSVVAIHEVRGDTETIVASVNKVAEAAGDSAASATELRASFEEVARRTDELFRSVEKSSSGTTQIDASARETLNRASVLSGISSDLLSFVAEMDATIRNISGTAEETEKLAQEVSANADAGRGAVDQTVDGIRAVEDSAKKTAGAFDALQTSLGQIGQVLTFIDEVTNRTNLLSFNAAIIAAQAGTNDYGFSVIAEEVRQLADRTRQATKEISTIIRSLEPVAKQAQGALNDSVTRVDRTVALANNATTSLAKIFDSSERSMKMSRMMARSLDEQARATQRLHEVTAQMTEHVEEIHRATRGQAEATRILATEAERVSDIAEGVRRATTEQMVAGNGIANAMEQIASDVRGIRDSLQRQLQQAENIAHASRATLTIAKRNNEIAENFSAAIDSLVTSGSSFDQEVGRFRL